MARLSQSTLRTVRFYEEEGLLQPVERTHGGHRLFPMRELRKLLLVSDLREAGFPLEEIRAMLEAKGRATSGAAASSEVMERLGHKVDVMNARISLLKRLTVELEAAKKHLVACTHCEDRNYFPKSCGDCSVMKGSGAIPVALGVLWDVDG